MNIDPSKSKASRRRGRRAGAKSENEERLARDAAIEGAEHVEVLVDDLFVEELDVPLALPRAAAPEARFDARHAGHTGSDVFVTPAAPLPPEAPPTALAADQVLAAEPLGSRRESSRLSGRPRFGIDARSLVGRGLLGGAIALVIVGAFAAARSRTKADGWRRWAGWAA